MNPKIIRRIGTLFIVAGVAAIIVQFAVGTPVMTLDTEKKGFSWPGAGIVLLGITVLVGAKRKPPNGAGKSQR